MPEGPGVMPKPQSGLIGLIFWCCGNREEIARETELEYAEGGPGASITSAEQTELEVSSKNLPSDLPIEAGNTEGSQPSPLASNPPAPENSALPEPIPAPDTPPTTTSQSTNAAPVVTPTPAVQQPEPKTPGTGASKAKDGAHINEDWVVVASDTSAGKSESTAPPVDTAPPPVAEAVGSSTGVLPQESESQLSAEASSLTAEASTIPLTGEDSTSISREPSVAVTVDATPSTSTGTGGAAPKGSKKGSKKKGGGSGGGKKGGGKKGKKKN